MDIFNSLHAKLDKKVENPLLMIAPSMSEVPADGTLKYRAIETVRDLTDTASANEVVLFRDDQIKLLTMLCEFDSTFGYDVVVVSGIPATTYTPEFASVTWDKRQIAYHSVVNDLIEANRRVEETESEIRADSLYKREQDSFVRKTGNVKMFTSFEEDPEDGGDDGDR